MFLYLENNFVKYFSEEKAIFESWNYKIQMKNWLVETSEELKEVEYNWDKEIILWATHYQNDEIFYNPWYLKEEKNTKYKNKVSALSHAISTESSKLQELIKENVWSVYIEQQTSILQLLKNKIIEIEKEIWEEEMINILRQIQEDKYRDLLA
jgi:hypothetical protein